MQTDPLVEWQRLTETYRSMYDDQLLDLAADPDSLTEQARQVLSDEMRKRNLRLPQAADSPRNFSGAGVTIPDSMSARAGTSFGIVSNAPDVVPDQPESSEETAGQPDLPREYTWKTPLCECEDNDQAWQICEMLRRAGIESWTDGPSGTYSPYSPELDLRTPRILVAADQLDLARQIAESPIPKDIVEQSKLQAPEFELPVCPKCGAADPVLESIDPVNTWHCEACENEWTEPAGDPPDGQEQASR